jgi:hypothetical protein
MLFQINTIHLIFASSRRRRHPPGAPASRRLGLDYVGPLSPRVVTCALRTSRLRSRRLVLDYVGPLSPALCGLARPEAGRLTASRPKPSAWPRRPVAGASRRAWRAS